ncbi:unnamed protein product [Effrenium voratum]|nr:unnamed protein product [Effrenium voratum]
MCSETGLAGRAERPSALMFRLFRKMSQEEFLHEFDALFGYGNGFRPYNFVHLPWTSLAVVNFTSTKACADCFALSKEVMKFHRCCIKGVRIAARHGLQKNLSDFFWRVDSGAYVSRSPLVFACGAPISLDQARQWLQSEAKDFQVVAWAHSVAKPGKILIDL